jgi:hypothetical protein
MKTKDELKMKTINLKFIIITYKMPFYICIEVKILDGGFSFWLGHENWSK